MIAPFKVAPTKLPSSVPDRRPLLFEFWPLPVVTVNPPPPVYARKELSENGMLEACIVQLPAAILPAAGMLIPSVAFKVRAVKLKDWKFHYAFMPEPRVTEPPLMRLVNLRSDPREESDIKDVNPWAVAHFDKIVAEFTASTERHPNVPPNAKDPYTPTRR